DDIIGVALKGDGRLFPLHPGIERVMQEEIRKDGANATPLRDPLSSRDEGAILPLHGGLEPPCHIQEDPWTGRVRAERPQQQLVTGVVKNPFVSELQAPVVSPASRRGHAGGLFSRLPRFIPIRVGVKMRPQYGLWGHAPPRLPNPTPPR